MKHPRERAKVKLIGMLRSQPLGERAGKTWYAHD